MLAFSGPANLYGRAFLAVDSASPTNAAVMGRFLPSKMRWREEGPGNDRGFPLVTPYALGVLGSQYILDGFTSQIGFLEAQYVLALQIALTLAENINVATTQAQIRTTFIGLNISINVQDAMPNMHSVISILLSSSMSIVDTQQHKYTIKLLLPENINIFDELTAGGFGRTGYVMNANTTAVSVYEGWEFTSMAKIGQKYYATGPEGLVELAGDTDGGLPIDALIRTGQTDFEESLLKRMIKAYIGIASDGVVYLRTITNDGDVRTYKCDIRDQNLHEERVDLGKGVKSRYWQFELENVTGSDMTIETIEYFPVILSRHV